MEWTEPRPVRGFVFAQAAKVERAYHLLAIPAEAGLRRQDVGANIHTANGPQGTQQVPRLIASYEDCARALERGFLRDDGPLMLFPNSRFPIPDSRFPSPGLQ